MLFQGEGEAFNVGAFIESISPYAWAATGIALCIGLSVVGAAWSVKQQHGNKQEVDKKELIRILWQGHFYHGHIDSGSWCQGASNPDQELDLHHLLRSRGYLRCHHYHYPLLQA